MALIEVTNLSKTYFGEGTATTALRDVSFTVEQGEFISIMGPSGSGKSTLLHILGLLDRPTHGTYLFDSADTSTFDDAELAHLRNKKLGFVFQQFHLLARASVWENVLLPMAYAHLSRQESETRAREALELVHMTHRLNHTPSQLSGGEKQRVAIARALVNKPLVIFADEPTGNLDTKMGQVVIDTIDELHKEGHTIIVITHEHATASYAQRIISLRDGQIISDTKVVKEHTHQQYEK